LQKQAPSTFIQIVPRLTNKPNGVADYGLALARALRVHGIDSVFLTATPLIGGRARQNEWNTISVPKREARSLAETIASAADPIKATAILLHMSGYGYSKRGAPLWLLQGLRRWRVRYDSRLPFITIFHEVYAMGRPWESSFWLSPVQRIIARSILNLSSNAIATTQLFRDQLLKWNDAARVTSMPVFSNVGEPSQCVDPSVRSATAVVFGLAGVENRLFGTFRPDLERVIATLGIEEIIDIGPRSSVPTRFAGVPIISKGVLPEFAVSELLQQARLGFVAYPFDVLAKSGVFAAYAAHGTIPVVFAERRGSFDGLQAGRHFLDGVKLRTPINVDHLGSMQRELFNWYRTHSLRVQAHYLCQCAAHAAAARSR
jgi:hypothetical protein